MGEGEFSLTAYIGVKVVIIDKISLFCHFVKISKRVRQTFKEFSLQN